jgi:hypothetical protein
LLKNRFWGPIRNFPRPLGRELEKGLGPYLSLRR